MGRPGIGASVASAVLFTTLLVVNSAVCAAADQAFTSSRLTHAEHVEAEQMSIVAALAQFRALYDAQEYLESHALGCRSPGAGLTGGGSGSGRTSGVWYNYSYAWRPSDLARDAPDDSGLGGLGGYADGSLNIDVAVSVDESYGGALPSYSGTEARQVHLPVPLVVAASLCLRAMGELASSLSSSSCTSSSAARAFSLLEPSLREMAAEDGLTLSSGWSLDPSTCVLGYWVTIGSATAAGVSGTFSWSEADTSSVLVR